MGKGATGPGACELLLEAARTAVPGGDLFLSERRRRLVNARHRRGGCCQHRDGGDAL